MVIFNVNKFVKSISNAIRGFRYILREQNFRILVLFSFIVFTFILLFNLKIWEVVVLTMMVVFVLVLEIINSIFERIMDILQPRIHPYAKIVKDMMAAVVLVASLGFLFIVLLIFWSHFRNFFIAF